MKLRLDIDGETFDRLIEVAAQERRPPDWQAEVLLRQALGLPFPYPRLNEERRDGWMSPVTTEISGHVEG